MSQNALNPGLSALPLIGDERITYEDVLRGRDRLKVFKTRAGCRERPDCANSGHSPRAWRVDQNPCFSLRLPPHELRKSRMATSGYIAFRRGR